MTHADAFGPGRRGVFLSVEGGEGAGKSTQIERLERRLMDEAGLQPLRVREPGGTSGGEAVRALLLQGHAHAWTPMAQTLLFYAARAQLWSHAIAPALAAGRWVIADRFADSTEAYQGAGGVEPARIAALHDIAVRDARPDLTLLLDIAPAQGLARAQSRAGDAAPDAFEAKDVAFHERVRAGFHAIAAREPERVTIIDADQDSDAVAAAIWARVEPVWRAWSAGVVAQDASHG